MHEVKKVFNSIVIFICKSKLFLIMVICCILVEFTIAKTMPYVDSNGMSVEKLNKMATIEKEDYNRIVLGDSRSHQGVNPKVLDKNSNYKTFNLAAPGMQTPFFYYSLKKWIELHEAPEQVVVNISFYLLGGMQWMEDIYFSYYTPTIEEAFDSYANELNYKGSDAVMWYIKTRIPSLRYNKKIRSLFSEDYNTFRNTLKTSSGIYEKQVVSYEDYGGYYSRGTDFISDDDIEEKDVTYPTTLHNGYSVYIDYMERFFELSTQYDFDIYVYDFPWPVKYGESESFLEAYAFYNDMINEIIDKYPNVHKLSNQLYYENKYFVDPLHVNDNGATKLSSEIGELIN